jgi:hypothetical protein
MPDTRPEQLQLRLVAGKMQALNAKFVEQYYRGPDGPGLPQ